MGHFKAATWLRASTDEQTTDNQRRQLVELAEHRDLEIVREFDLSGVSAFRGGQERYISEAIKEARLGKFKVLLIWALDRLSREGIAKTLDIVNRFQRVGCGIVSLQESEIDTTGPNGELIIAVMAHLANIESRRRSERTKAGLERAKADGRVLGRPTGSRDKRQRKKSGYFKRWSAARDEVGTYRIN